MATKSRKLNPQPKLTHKLWVTVAVCAEVMAAEQTAITEAMRDPYCRAELKELVYDLASMLEVIREEAKKQTAFDPKSLKFEEGA